MRFVRETDEVYRSAGPLTKVDGTDIAQLKQLAARNARQRVRLCAHLQSADRLHEMVIVLGKRVYVPPHKHADKSESYHIIEGMLSMFLFDDSGVVRDVIRMGTPESGRVFFHRLTSGTYHSLVAETEQVVFHEVTNGPFDPATMLVAPWAPALDDLATQARFVDALKKNAERGAAP